MPAGLKMDVASGLVSVVIPTYNARRFLVAAIDSALEQTYLEKEIIVIDDGSTDDTAAVLGGYGSKIRTLYQQNRGVSAARNAGIRESRGDLIAFLDADDVWQPDKLARQAALFDNPAVGLVHCGMQYIDEDGKMLGVTVAGGRGRVLTDLALLQPVVLGGGSGAMVRRAVFDKVGVFDEGLSTSADWDMWRRIACFWEFDMVSAALCWYRLHSSSMHRNVAVFEHDMLRAFSNMFADPAAREVFAVRRQAYGTLYVTLSGSHLYAGNVWQCLAYAARSVAIWPPSIAYLAAYPFRAFARRLGWFADRREPAI